jgi:hypothetical protein
MSQSWQPSALISPNPVTSASKTLGYSTQVSFHPCSRLGSSLQVRPCTDAAGSLVRRLKSVRASAKVWSRHNRAPPAIIQNCKFLIMLFDTLEEDRSLSQGERQLWEQSYERLAMELKQRAAYWKQRAKFRAVREGDSNTAFFHAHATTRMRRNTIKSIAVNRVQVTNHSVKVHALTEHFKGIIGIPGSSVWHFSCAQLYYIRICHRPGTTSPYRSQSKKQWLQSRA